MAAKLDWLLYMHFCM